MGDGGTSVGQASRLQMVLAEAPVGDRPARHRRFADDRTF